MVAAAEEFVDDSLALPTGLPALLTRQAQRLLHCLFRVYWTRPRMRSEPASGAGIVVACCACCDSAERLLASKEMRAAWSSAVHTLMLWGIKLVFLLHEVVCEIIWEQRHHVVPGQDLAAPGRVESCVDHGNAEELLQAVDAVPVLARRLPGSLPGCLGSDGFFT